MLKTRLAYPADSVEPSDADDWKSETLALECSNPRFPRRLCEVPSPPSILFVRGQAGALAESRLFAVVGSREPSVTGEQRAREMTEQIAAVGAGLVSGLAEGIDAIAHTVALEAATSTIAVLGGGLDRISPRRNLQLAERILDSGGALISERPLGAPVLPAYLVARNRLISGLAAAVLIVECAPDGGTMHTARFAAAQGRPIFIPEEGAGEATRMLCERYGAQPMTAERLRRALDAVLDEAGVSAFRQLAFDAHVGEDQPSQGSV